MTLKLAEPGTLPTFEAWSDVYVPILLDQDSDTLEWTIVATFFHCNSWYDLGRPSLPYTEYRFSQGKWVRHPLSPKWIGRTVNLLPADLSMKALLEETRPVLNVERQQARIGSILTPEYKRIVAAWKTTC